MKCWFHPIGVSTIALCTVSCSQEAEKPTTSSGVAASGNVSAAGNPGLGANAGAGGGPAIATGGAPLTIGSSGGATLVPSIQGGNNTGGGTSAPETCAATYADTGLEPVYLGFAFDVSGSMGKGDEPYHDVELKWKPVVSATKAFFADPSSSKISASLSFFPAKNDKCDASSYAEPDVPMTALPSDAFASAIDAITPKSADEWRGGTPTLAVISGVSGFLRSFRANLGAGKFALVLVSDGYPQGCDHEEDEIETVAEEVARVATEFPTYVIGVSNPAGGPDTVSNLNRVAEAGGTEKAFLIKTGDPEQTSRDFKMVINAIRGRTLSCQATIPKPPDGAVLDTSKVNVSYTKAGELRPLAYDPACTEAGAWRFDDPTQPTRIELCDAACGDVQASADVKLSVEFGCETRPVIPR
ncbi:MAG TPA: vWA domain-containing protein [Polyangiaceae bacterium]|nr:vWA domain-containing protein [Polyangiaceae bacterium]